MKVTIFEDPYTRSTPEGPATLLKPYQSETGLYPDGYERWDVRFDTGEVCSRIIHVSQRQAQPSDTPGAEEA